MKNSGPNNVFLWKSTTGKVILEEKLSVLKKQEVILAKKENIYDLFPEGEYVLQWEVMPLLKETFGAEKESKEISCDIYYINRGYVANILWGTGEPVLLSEPTWEMDWSVRLNGECNVRVANSKLFLKYIFEQEKEFEQGELNRYLRKLLLNDLRENLNRIMAEREIQGEEIESDKNQISLLLWEIYENTIAKIGLELVSLCINEVFLTKVEKIFKNEVKEEISETIVSTIICMHCGTKTPHRKFCMECGNSLPELKKEEKGIPIYASAVPLAKIENKKCPRCGVECAISFKFCENCGMKLEIF